MGQKFISPFPDEGFKRIFGNEEKKSVMISFLNTMINGDAPIVDITYMDKEQTAEEEDGKTVIYDLYCKTDDGRHVIVEMQNSDQSFFKNRTIYYAARSIGKQGKKGKWRYNLKAVYVIALMNFTQKEISDRVRTEAMLMDIETKQLFSDLVHFIYIQLPLFKKTEAECENDFDYWTYILNNMEKLDKMPFTDKNPVFIDLMDMASYQGLTEEEQWAYDKSLMRMWDANACLEDAEEKGMIKGREQGMQQGMQQGKLETAANLKKMGIPMDTIIAATGLTQEQVEAL
ncbi:MAG: Rpn family recombination-promoting nuclease/putative transposase [Bacteroidaceae bacterium]|nr:Rpn family recombination-promoting nuclease/putative transposase [Bacteroidaceae bacterium]